MLDNSFLDAESMEKFCNKEQERKYTKTSNGANQAIVQVNKTFEMKSWN